MNQTVLGLAIAAISALVGLTWWLFECIRTAEARYRRDLEHRAARLERQGLRFARLASECAEWSFVLLSAENNANARTCFRAVRAVEAKLRRKEEDIV